MLVGSFPQSIFFYLYSLAITIYTHILDTKFYLQMIRFVFIAYSFHSYTIYIDLKKAFFPRIEQKMREKKTLDINSCPGGFCLCTLIAEGRFFSWVAKYFLNTIFLPNSGYLECQLYYKIAFIASLGVCGKLIISREENLEFRLKNLYF